MSPTHHPITSSHITGRCLPLLPPLRLHPLSHSRCRCSFPLLHRLIARSAPAAFHLHLACNASAARACRGCGWTWPCIGATSAAFAMIILHLPNSSGSGAFSVIQPHFLLSQLLKQRVPQAAEWLFVCLLAATGVLGACTAVTAHLKGDNRWLWWCCSCFVEVAVVAVAVH